MNGSDLAAAGLAFQASEAATHSAKPATDSPLRSYLELAALAGAVPCARLHTRQVLWEWGLTSLVEAVELVVSEIITNAVRASGGLDPPQRHLERDRLPFVRLWLAADQQRVLVQVWDGSDREPKRRQPGLDAEGGRGLLLVEALSTEWGSFVPNTSPGKVVWAICTAE